MKKLFWTALLFSAPFVSAEPTFSMKEVGKHGTATDCWIVISGSVYDITAYIDKHPSSKTILAKYCGKDGTEGWKTKDMGKSHSRAAERLLKRFLKGSLSDQAAPSS